MAKRILDVRNLCFAHYKKPMCLNDISFDVFENQNLLAVGTEESGKSTLLKSLSGFDSTYIGSVRFKGKEVKNIADNEKKFSLLFSEPVLVSGSIKKNLDFLCKVENIEPLTEKEQVKLLRKFLIDKEINEKVKNLSLCEKRKLAMARSYLKKPNVLFCDDLFVGLNKQEVDEIKQIYELFFKEKIMLVAAFESESVKENFKFFKTANFAKILYLSLSKGYVYGSFEDLFRMKVDIDVLKLSTEYQVIDGYIANKDGAYYFVSNNDDTLKYDKKFYDKLVTMMIAPGETENACLVFDKKNDFDISDNGEFNKKLGNSLWLFSLLDKSRVI